MQPFQAPGLLSGPAGYAPLTGSLLQPWNQLPLLDRRARSPVRRFAAAALESAPPPGPTGTRAQSLLPAPRGKRHSSDVRVTDTEAQPRTAPCEQLVGLRPHDNAGGDGAQRTPAHGHRVHTGLKWRLDQYMEDARALDLTL